MGAQKMFALGLVLFASSVAIDAVKLSHEPNSSIGIHPPTPEDVTKMMDSVKNRTAEMREANAMNFTTVDALVDVVRDLADYIKELMYEKKTLPDMLNETLYLALHALDHVMNASVADAATNLKNMAIAANKSVVNVTGVYGDLVRNRSKEVMQMADSWKAPSAETGMHILERIFNVTDKITNAIANGSAISPDDVKDVTGGLHNVAHDFDGADALDTFADQLQNATDAAVKVEELTHNITNKTLAGEIPTGRDWEHMADGVMTWADGWEDGAAKDFVRAWAANVKDVTAAWQKILRTDHRNGPQKLQKKSGPKFLW